MHHRFSITCVIAAALQCATATGCSKERAKDEERRALLKPSDYRQQREEVLRKQQVAEPSGELIPSDEVVAGLRLPRGFTRVLGLERRWYYRSTRVPFAALDQYFSNRLLTGQLERGLDSVVTFANAHIKENSNAPRVTVRLTRLHGVAPNEATEIFIEQDGPPKLALTPEQADAQLLEQRRFPR